MTGHAQVVFHILKPRLACPPPVARVAISHLKWRNSLLSSRAHDRDSPRFRIAPSYHQKPLLSRHCSFHHHPPVSVSAMSSSKAVDHYRLPTDLRPRHYDLTIRTDFEKDKFSGFVKIECA